MSTLCSLAFIKSRTQLSCDELVTKKEAISHFHPDHEESCSGSSSYITGQTIVLDVGLTAQRPGVVPLDAQEHRESIEECC